MDHPFMIIKNEDHGFLYLGLFIPKPKAVQWPHETCIGFQILDNFSMHRGIQPKKMDNWTAYPYWYLLLYTFASGLCLKEKINRITIFSHRPEKCEK
jgi:hypothetical protein